MEQITLLAIRPVAAVALDVQVPLGVRPDHFDGSLHLGAILDADSPGNYFADEVSAPMDFHSIAGHNVPLQCPAYDDFAGLYTRRDHPFPSDAYVAAGQGDGTLDPAFNVNGFGTADLPFDQQRFANVCHFPVRRRGVASGWFPAGRQRWAAWVFLLLSSRL